MYIPFSINPDFIKNSLALRPLNPTTDYMSKDGANAYIAFWEEKLLSNERLSGLIDKVGMSIFEDSLEFGSYFGADNLEWSATFLEEFEQRAGYDLTPYLPLLNGQSMGCSTNVEYYDYEFGVYNEETCLLYTSRCV